jgi:hypothetical protein
MDEPSVLENLPDKVLKLALKIIKPHYTGNPDVDLDNTNFTSSCDEVVKMTGLSSNDYGETSDYSFLHQLMELNPDFDSSESLEKPTFNNFEFDWEVTEKRVVSEHFRHSLGSYNPTGNDVKSIFKFLFYEGVILPDDGKLLSDEIESTEVIEDNFVPGSIRKI